jgi:hypothetical protein
MIRVLPEEPNYLHLPYRDYELKSWLAQSSCYYSCVFNLGKPKTAGDWLVHVVLGVVALFLIWWMMHMFF